jgi:hypothetical protein
MRAKPTLTNRADGKALKSFTADILLFEIATRLSALLLIEYKHVSHRELC